ncbi:MAG: response regulator [Elusimicrobia bacterium]|nr:response regulator [Elusimicrobiota bacterium]
MADENLAEPKDKLVLIVEDDEPQRYLIKAIVVKEGFQVDVAVDGPAAMKKIAAKTPDLIILDLMMPGKNGVEVLRDLQSEGVAGIPVIILTARMMDPAALEILRQEPSVKEVMTKPPHVTKLPAALHSLMSTKAPPKPPASDVWRHSG